jgi:hypothetical protein
MPERFRRSLGRPRREQNLPLGHLQHNHCQGFSTSGRRLGLRVCLRCGCRRIYRARRWNQRYCQDAECRKLLRRWQAARRQQQRRQRPEVRQAQAEAERKRRTARRAAAAREQAAPDADRGAWSRSKNISAPFCDRPGCHGAVRSCCRCPARYCGDNCREAVRRVRDRERKWLTRHAHTASSRKPRGFRSEHSAEPRRAPASRAGPAGTRARGPGVSRQL